MKIKIGSLFAGVGGIELGLLSSSYKHHKFEVVWANEIDPYALQTYQQNFSHTLIEGDIQCILNPRLADTEEQRDVYNKKLELITNEKIDMLTGGFPCQAFSIAGERKGFNDERGNLFWSITGLIQKLSEKPRFLLLENVKNLKGHDDGRTYNIIKSELEKIGYIIKDRVINTLDITNIPQNRERIYILGFKDPKDAEKFKFFDDDVYLRDKINFNKRDRVDQIKSVISDNITIESHHSLYYTENKYPHYYTKDRINLDLNITEENEFYQIRRGVYVRKNQKGVSPTLTANMGTGGHNVALIKVQDGIRKLSAEEAFKLQGFPVDKGYILPKINKKTGKKFPSGQLYKQAGNAVTVDVVHRIGSELLKIL